MTFLLFLTSLLLPILTTLIALKYQFPKDLLIPKKEFFNKNKWQRLNAKGKWYVFISLILVLLIEIGLIVKGVDTSEKTIFVKVPSEAKIIYVPKVIRDTQLIKESEHPPTNNPLMDIWSDSTGFIGTFPNNVIMRVAFRCINNGIAYQVRGRLQSFVVINKKLMIIGSKGSKIANTSLMAYGNVGLYIAFKVDIPKNPRITDTTYYFFKAVYSDQELKGKNKLPL